jgi:pilus assembly protein Flp/PilA
MNFRNWFNKMVARAAGATVREDGQAMVEYGLIVGLISIVAITLLVTIGGDLKNVFQSVVTGLSSV